MREYGRFTLGQSTSIELPLGSTVSMTVDPDDLEIYARFPNGSVKKMTGSGTGGGFLTASNGLSAVGTDVRFGGELSANTTLRLGPNLGPAYELEITHGTVIQRGGTGANRISGAGTYYQYAPVHTTLAFGTVSGTQWDILPNWSLMMGLDNQAQDASLSIINGFNVDVEPGQSTLYTIINSNNMGVSGYSRTNSYWLDQSSLNTYTGAVIHSMTRGESNSYFPLPVTNNQDYFHSNIISRNSEFYGSNFSYIHGDTLSLTKEVDRSIVFGSNITSSSGSSIILSNIIGDNILFNSVLLNLDTSKVQGVDITFETAATNVSFTDIHGESITITGVLNNSSLMGSFISTSNVSYSSIIGSNTDLTNSFGNLLIGDSHEGENLQYSIVTGTNHTLNTTTILGRSVVAGTDIVVNDTLTDSIVIGTSNTIGTVNNGSFIIGNSLTVNNVTGSIIHGNSTLSINPVSTADGCAIIGVGSVAMKTYTGSTILPNSYTLYFEDQVSLLPGGGVTLVSPDGLTRTKLTIDNAGAAVWTILP